MWGERERERERPQDAEAPEERQRRGAFRETVKIRATTPRRRRVKEEAEEEEEQGSLSRISSPTGTRAHLLFTLSCRTTTAATRRRRCGSFSGSGDGGGVVWSSQWSSVKSGPRP